MTKKDYQRLADAFRNAKPPTVLSDAEAQWKLDVKMVAVALLADNSRFDKERFLKAAGVE